METEELFSARGWVGATLALVGGLSLGSLLFPRRLYDRVVWQYFWGPVYSDANNARCAVSTAEGIELHASNAACGAAADTGVVAYTGYTSVSTLGYMLVLLFMLVGVYHLIDRLQVGHDRELVIALVPFMLFGGAVRVVEDVTDAAVAAGVDPVLTYPENTLFISPIIYVTVFAITVAALLASMRLEAADYVPSYHRGMLGIGSGILGLTLAYLFWVATTKSYAGFYPGILLVDVGLASVLAYGLYVAADRYDPEIHAGTGPAGLVVLWAHAIDGVANVVAADWLPAFGHPIESYSAKHVVNRAIISLTEAVQPAGVSAAVGTSWPFLGVKLVVALGIVWLFDEVIFEETPRYAVLLLIAASAVGLGPGTRDMLRVTFAI
jgi:uncharacterized membrane protein